MTNIPLCFCIQKQQKKTGMVRQNKCVVFISFDKRHFLKLTDYAKVITEQYLRELQ